MEKEKEVGRRGRIGGENEDERREEEGRIRRVFLRYLFYRATCGPTEASLFRRFTETNVYGDRGSVKTSKTRREMSVDIPRYFTVSVAARVCVCVERAEPAVDADVQG